jgi:peptidoglycan-associated lipoprotein
MLRARSLLAALAAVPLVVACAGSKPPAKTAAGPTSTQPQTRALETPQQAASSGSIQISDEVRKACGIDDQDAYFAFDSHALRSQDLPVLNKVAECFSTGPLAGRTMKLVGRADPRGEAEYNMTLGQARADAVAQYVQKRGVAKPHVQSTSRGAMDATGTDEATWQRDRRVDVMLGT